MPTDPLPPGLSLEWIEELQAQCRNAFDLPQIRLSELSALLREVIAWRFLHAPNPPPTKKEPETNV